MNIYKSNIFSYSWTLYIKKWFKRWGMEGLLELFNDSMKYVVFEDSLLEALKMKCQDTKMSKFGHFIVNFNLDCWVQGKVKMPKRFQTH